MSVGRRRDRRRRRREGAGRRKWRHRGLPGAERHAARLRRMVRQHGVASRGRPRHARVRAVPGVLGGRRQLRQERQLVVAGARPEADDLGLQNYRDALQRHRLLDVVQELAGDLPGDGVLHGDAGRDGGVRVLAPAVPGAPSGPADDPADPDVPVVRGRGGDLRDHAEDRRGVPRRSASARWPACCSSTSVERWGSTRG